MLVRGLVKGVEERRIVGSEDAAYVIDIEGWEGLGRFEHCEFGTWD